MKSQTFKNPPMHQTRLTPREIIGVNNIDIFEEHYAIASRSTNDGEFPTKELNKKIGQEDRQHVAETLAKLREFGFFPLGYNSTGGISWGMVLKSESQVAMERGLHELERYSQEEIMDMGRRGYLNIIKNATIEPAKDYELNREEVDVI